MARQDEKTAARRDGAADPGTEAAATATGDADQATGAPATHAPDPQTAGSTALTPTGRVILGMIAFGKRTGYDIKQLVDRSVRHFWAASYGQIYPELRRLEAQGLIAGHPEPSGGRSRTVYDLTDAGRRSLDGWLTGASDVGWELRDEGMLKLFFSDLTDPEHRLENIRAMRAVQERKRAQLLELQASVPEMPPGPRMTLEMGLGTTQWLIGWCDEMERRLSADREGGR